MLIISIIYITIGFIVMNVYKNWFNIKTKNNIINLILVGLFWPISLYKFIKDFMKY